jgi:hypothetical protein
MKSLELFAGVGGLAMGCELAGFKPAAVIEWNKWACETIRENQERGFPLVENWMLHQGDVRDFDWSSLSGTIDLVSGGRTMSTILAWRQASGARRQARHVSRRRGFCSPPAAPRVHFRERQGIDAVLVFQLFPIHSCATGVSRSRQARRRGLARPRPPFADREVLAARSRRSLGLQRSADAGERGGLRRPATAGARFHHWISLGSRDQMVVSPTHPWFRRAVA